MSSTRQIDLQKYMLLLYKPSIFQQIYIQELQYFFMRAKEINFSGRTIKNLKIIKLIGQGNWADVYLAEDINTHEKAAVKVTSQKKLDEVPKLRQLIKAEIAILKQCKSPNVVQLYSDFVFQDHQFIVLEYCNGFDLRDILLRERKLDEPTAVNYIKQILNGFKGLHEIKAMHRDFKAENVMLHEGVCKIVDLGFGKQLNVGQLATTRLGSNLTMAPEVMQGLSYDFRADIWSIGVVYYQMLYGSFPLQARGPNALLQKARNQDYSLESETVSQQSKDFIAKCLKFNPQQRISWENIYRHPLIADESHDINIGPPQSKINVEENINFYLKKNKQLEEEVVSPSVVRDSAFKSIIKPKEEEIKKREPQQQEEQKQVIQNQPSQGLLNVIKEEMPYKPYTNQQQARKAQLARNQELSQRYLRKERLRITAALNNIKYRYMEYINNIEFISRFTISTMLETQKLGCNINHTPIICLLLKAAYILLDDLNDSLNLGRNIFNFDPIQIKYFLDDQEFHQILRLHLNEFKQLFEYYRCFLSQQLRDPRLEEALRDISKPIPEDLLDEYICIHAKKIARPEFSANWNIRCRLLKLSYCLSNYSRYKYNCFSRRHILLTLNNFNYERANAEQNLYVIDHRNQPRQPVRRFNYFQRFWNWIGFA